MLFINSPLVGGKKDRGGLGTEARFRWVSGGGSRLQTYWLLKGGDDDELPIWGGGLKHAVSFRVCSTRQDRCSTMRRRFESTDLGGEGAGRKPPGRTFQGHSGSAGIF